MCDLSTKGLCTCRCHAWTVWPNKLHPSPAASAPLHVPSVCALPHPAAGQQPLPSYRRWCPVSNYLCFSPLSVLCCGEQHLTVNVLLSQVFGHSRTKYQWYCEVQQHGWSSGNIGKHTETPPPGSHSSGHTRSGQTVFFVYLYICNNFLACCVIIEAMFWVILA